MDQLAVSAVDGDDGGAVDHDEVVGAGVGEEALEAGRVGDVAFVEGDSGGDSARGRVASEDQPADPAPLGEELRGHGAAEIARDAGDEVAGVVAVLGVHLGAFRGSG